MYNEVDPFSFVVGFPAEEKLEINGITDTSGVVP
jgi:hypothetical protein